MTETEFLEKCRAAAKKFAEGKTPKKPETQFLKGAQWAWDLLMSGHEAVYYEEVLRREITNRLGTVEPWQESLISDTAVMMADRDGLMADIVKDGRLLTKYDKNMQPYKESNPLYVHLKEKERSIGMQREHLGLSFKVNPTKMKESPKRADKSEDPMYRFMRGAEE